jgi:aspartyl-tRNA(Asn)/glutamyl-tRNA(Gln) amidotransferase subunit B
VLFRSFPDPDLLPVVVSDEQLAAIKAALPELPGQMRVRFEQDYGLSVYDAQLLTASAANARYFDALVAQLGAEQAKLAANWMNGELAKSLNKADLSLEESPIAADALAGLLIRIVDNTVSGKLAKQVFEAMWAGEGSADQIIDAKGLKQITDSGAIEKIVDEVLAANAKQVEAYKGGQEKMFGFFVGQVMKLSKGQANPAQVNDLLQEKLKN